MEQPGKKYMQLRKSEYLQEKAFENYVLLETVFSDVIIPKELNC